MKTVLGTLSVIDAVMGVLLLGVVAVGDDVPPIVLGIALGMLVQAGYTLAYMAGTLSSFQPWSTRALLAGQTVALVVGSLGFITSALYNTDPPNSDPEYGPLTVGALIAAQAATALWLYAEPRRSRVRA